MEEIDRSLSNAQQLHSLKTKLRIALETLGKKRLLGAQLGPMITAAAAPGPSYKEYYAPGMPGALRTFVNDYLTDLIVPTAERSGSDILFEVGGVLAGESQITSEMLWKTFVAVEPSYVLAFDKNQESLATFRSGTEIGPEFQRIMNVTFEDHQSFCERFCEEECVLASDSQPKLKALSEQYSKEFYHSWLEALRASTPRLEREWGKFRKQEVLKLFRTRLYQLAVRTEKIEELALLISAGQQQAYSAHQPRLAMASNRKQNPTDTLVGTEEGEVARQLLCEILGHMDMTSLRTVLVPFGAVLDAVSKKRP